MDEVSPPPPSLLCLSPSLPSFGAHSERGRKTVINRGVISTSPHAMTKRAGERARKAFRAICPSQLLGLGASYIDELRELKLVNYISYM